MLKLLYWPVRWFIYAPIFALNTLLIASACVVLAKISPTFATRHIAPLWAKIGFMAAPACLKVSGRQHIDNQQAYVVVANHVSQFDILALYGFLGLDLKWVMKQELRKAPIIGAACAAMGHVFLNRESSTEAMKALEAVKEQLEPGMSIMFFPEGTRTDGTKIRRFKRGAFMMAKNLDLPILPISIKGTEKILPNGTLDLMPGKAEIIIHEPISVAKVRELRDRDLAKLSEETVKKGLGLA